MMQCITDSKMDRVWQDCITQSGVDSNARMDSGGSLRSIGDHFLQVKFDNLVVVGNFRWQCDSASCNVVVLYASKYGDVRTVINVSGRFDLTIGTEARFGKKGMEILHEGFLDVKNELTGAVEYRVTLTSLEDRLATDMDASARSVSKDVRVLTIHGEVEEVVAVSDAHEFAKRIPNHALRIIVGGNHNYEESQNEPSTLVVEFQQDKLSKI